MKIVIPTADYPPIEGGISTVTVEVSRALARMGHNVTVVAPHFPGQDVFDAGEPVRVVRYRGYGLGWLRVFPLAWCARRLMREADLVLAINVAHGGLAAWWFGVPYVTFAYAYEFLKFQSVPPLAWLLRRVYARARAVAAISNYTREQLAAFGVDPDTIVTVFPGAPPPAEVTESQRADVAHRYLLEGRRVVLAVGRMVPRKNHVALVRALPRILEACPDALLVLVGRGRATATVTREAIDRGVRDDVRILGMVDSEDLAALYSLCGVFALPTGSEGGGQVEGFGLVFAEAAAYGKPVVAGRSGGVVDAVRDGETGILVEPDDDDALAAAVIRLLKDDALATRLGEAGKRRVAGELNWTRFTEGVLEAAARRGTP